MYESQSCLTEDSQETRYYQRPNPRRAVNLTLRKPYTPSKERKSVRQRVFIKSQMFNSQNMICFGIFFASFSIFLSLHCYPFCIHFYHSEKRDCKKETEENCRQSLLPKSCFSSRHLVRHLVRSYFLLIISHILNHKLWFTLCQFVDRLYLGRWMGNDFAKRWPVTGRSPAPTGALGPKFWLIRIICRMDLNADQAGH